MTVSSFRGIDRETVVSPWLTTVPSPTDSRRCAAPRTAPAGPGDNDGCGPASPGAQTAEQSKRENPERPRTPARKPPHPLPCLTCPSLAQLPGHPIIPTVVIILGPRYKTDHRLQTTRRPHRRDQVERTLARAHHPLLHRGPQTRPGVEGHHCTAPSARRPPTPLPGLELRGPQSTGIASPCQQTTPQNQRTSHHRDLSSSHRRVHFRDHHHRRHKHHQTRASTEAANALTIQPLAPKPTNKTLESGIPISPSATAPRPSSAKRAAYLHPQDPNSPPQ